MMKALMLLCSLTLLATMAAHADAPIIDNERVTVWDSGADLPVAAHDFLAVTLAGNGTVRSGHAGERPTQSGAPAIVIELKDQRVPPLANNSGYPLAFPRPRVEKLLENDRVVVWRYRWNKGEPTPMHFHDKDAVVIFPDATTLTSTTLDGKTVSNSYRSGEVRYNSRDRVHTETLVTDKGWAIITELK